MKHPPIPPKCEFFYNPRNPLFRISLAGAGFSIGVGEAIGTEREIIAAVAEVEWRKLAARWEDLKDLIYFSWEGGAPPKEHEDRFERMQSACTAAYENARAWREWGKQK